MPGNSPISEVLEIIAIECREASATEWDITKIVKVLSREKNPNIEELREKAICLLEEINPEAGKIYSSFHQLKVIKSNLEIQPFDRGNIIKSLLKETNINRTIAEKIGHEVEDRIKDLKISRLTTSLIREMVDAKLLEYGHEQIRNQYLRLGLPVFDVEKKINSSFFYSKSILEEYNLLKVIPQKISQSHFEKEIFISDIAGFSTRAFSYCEKDFENFGKNSFQQIFSAIERNNSLQKFFCKPLNFYALNFLLAELISSKKDEKECTENLSFALEKFPSKAIFGFPLFVPEHLEKISKNKEIAFGIAKQLLESNLKNTPIMALHLDSKYKLKLLGEKAFEKNFIAVNCSKKELFPLSKSFFSEKNVLLNSVVLNLPKICQKNAGKENLFFRELNEKIEMAANLSNLKLEILKKRDYFEKNKIPLDDSCSAISFFGLEQAANVFLEKSSEKDVLDFCEKIISSSLKQIDEKFVLCESNSHAVSKRFGFEKDYFANSDSFEKKVFKGFLKKHTAHSKAELIDLLDNGAEIIEFVPKN